jgi:hypothetical protein
VSQSMIFREVDADHDAEICLEFRVKSFVESFAERFYRAVGDRGKDYVAGLRAKNREWPGSRRSRSRGDFLVARSRQPASAHR